MKRIVITCAAVALGASVVPAASPQVNEAIKTVQTVGAAKMKEFCELDTALEAAEALGEKEDPALEKQMDDLLKQLGPQFTAAWELGDNLDETSPDATEFNAAVDALGDKCP